MTDFTIILRSLSGRLFSTVTTVLTVAVAVALMLTLLSMRSAGNQAFARGSGNMHLLVSGDASPMVSVLNGIFYANAPARRLPISLVNQLQADPRIEWAIPTQQGDSFSGFPVLATTPEFFTQFQPEEGRPWTLAEGSGRFLTADFEVVAGSAAAAASGLKVGDKINLTHGSGKSRASHVHTEFTYTVVGILNPTGSAHDRAIFTNLNSTWIIHAAERQEREAGHDHGDHDHDHDHDHAIDPKSIVLTDADRLVTGIYLRTATRAGSAVSAVMPQVASELRARGGEGFTVAEPVKETNQLFKIVSNVDIIFRALAAVVLLSSAISIMLALYNSMAERRRQIAVLRVLGASRPRVFGLILTESAFIGLIGAACGLLLAIGGAYLAAAVLQNRVGLVITPTFALDFTLPTLVAAILLATLAGLVPAAMAYRTSVAKSLKPIG